MFQQSWPSFYQNIFLRSCKIPTNSSNTCKHLCLRQTLVLDAFLTRFELPIHGKTVYLFIYAKITPTSSRISETGWDLCGPLRLRWSRIGQWPSTHSPHVQAEMQCFPCCSWCSDQPLLAVGNRHTHGRQSNTRCPKVWHYTPRRTAPVGSPRRALHGSGPGSAAPRGGRRHDLDTGSR